MIRHLRRPSASVSSWRSSTPPDRSDISRLGIAEVGDRRVISRIRSLARSRLSATALRVATPARPSGPTRLTSSIQPGTLPDHAMPSAGVLRSRVSGVGAIRYTMGCRLISARSPPPRPSLGAPLNGVGPGLHPSPLATSASRYLDRPRPRRTPPDSLSTARIHLCLRGRIDRPLLPPHPRSGPIP